MADPYVVTLGITGATTIVYEILLIRWWAWLTPERRRGQAFNAWTLAAVLAFAQYFLAGYLHNVSQMPQQAGEFEAIQLVIVALTTIPGAVALVGRVIRPKTPEDQQRSQAFLPGGAQATESPVRRDLRRKLSHVVQFAAIVAIDVLGFYALVFIFQLPLTPEWRLELWGYGPKEFFTFSWTWEGWVVPGKYIAVSRLVIFSFFYCLTFTMLTSELCRHTRSWRYGFDAIVHRTLRPNEVDGIAAYALFPAGFVLASIFLPYFGIIGTCAGWCLGDMAASQVGMRRGRHQFPHQKKTWEGLAAGTAVTFGASVAFLGIPWAVILAILFASADLLTEKPIPISDNLLLPILAVVVFTGLQMVGIQVAPIFISLV